MKRIFSAALCATIIFSFLSKASAAEKKEEKPVFDAIAASQADDDKYEWTYLFDGESLKHWTAIQDGDDIVRVEDDVLVLGMGPTTTLIRFEEEGSEITIPRENYEIEYVSRRTAGVDFFSALTFPIGDKYVTFVNGGWGGFVVGISNIDDMDASENSTSSFMNFKTDQWYRFRVQVTNRALRVWINDEKIIDYIVEGHSLRTRFEVSRCEPLGFASWASEGELKVVRTRALTEEEIEEIDANAVEAARFSF